MTIIQTTKKLKERTPYDYYETPYELARETLKFIFPTDNYRFRILDPGCGTGVWGQALKDLHPKVELTGVEMQSMKPFIYDKVINTNFLTWETTDRFDGVIGNPPYRFAEEFVRKSYDLLVDHGFIIFLLPLSFLESVKRGEGLFNEMPPTDVMVSMRRISFTKNRKSDNTAYAIYTWVKNSSQDTTLSWLNWNYDRPVGEVHG
jgi:hypothetical protein